jgi:LacI family transcriptional regulator
MITETNDVSTARDRLRGYREALEAAGIAFLPELIVETSTLDRRLACQATLDLLDHVEPPTALFVVNNIGVIGVAEAVRARPRDSPRRRPRVLRRHRPRISLPPVPHGHGSAR